MGVNPLSMVSKVQSTVFQNWAEDRRSARPAFATDFHVDRAVADPTSLRAGGAILRQSSMIPRPTAVPPYLTPPSARPSPARRRLRCRGSGLSTQFWNGQATAEPSDL